MILRQDISSVATELGVTAKYFKVVRISENAIAEFRGADWNLRTTIKSGLSIDLSVYGSPCEQIVFESVNAQTIEFWAGLAKVDDSSITGAVALDSASQVNYLAKINTSIAVEVFPANTARLAGTYQISAPCFLNDAVNGIKLPSGIYQWTNKQSLTLIPAAGSVDITRIDELF